MNALNWVSSNPTRPLKIQWSNDGVFASTRTVAGSSVPSFVQRSKLKSNIHVAETWRSFNALAEIETVQIHLAKIYANTNAAVCATRDAARAATEGDADALAKLLAARILASENAIALAQIGMRIGGGKAYNKMGPMERYLRDALASQVMAPSVDVLNIWLGKAITGQQIP